MEDLGQAPLLVGAGVERLLDEVATHLGELDERALPAPTIADSITAAPATQSSDSVVEQDIDVAGEHGVRMGDRHREVGEHREQGPARGEHRREPEGPRRWAAHRRRT